MDILLLKYFIKVCEHNSFTKSAKALYITQQALSRNINNLEKEVGAPLFIRNSRGVSLTDLGKDLHPKAKAIIKDFDNFVEEIHRQVNSRNKKLKVGFSPGTIQIIGTREIIAFSKNYLDMEIGINEYVDIDCEKNVLNENLDIAITANPQGEKGLSFYPLFKRSLVALVNKENPISCKDCITFNDLKNENLVLLDETFRLQSVLMKHFKNVGFSPKVIFKSYHDLNIAYEFVALNKGIFVFIDGLNHIEDYHNIVCVPIDVSTAYWEVGIVVKNDAIINNEMSNFMDFFIDKYSHG